MLIPCKPCKLSKHVGYLLITTRFQYFEQLADVQMLAMLSCVLSEFSIASNSPAIDETSNHHTRSQDQRNSPNCLNQKTTGSSNYYPTFEIAKNMLRHMSPRRPDPEKRASGPQSTSSSVGATISDPLTPYSTGATPPGIHRPTAVSFERHDSQMSTTPAQPEHQQNTYRSSSNLASTFAASFSRPFSFNTSISSSPPTTYLKKRLSPAGSYTGPQSTGVNWGAATFFAKQSTITEDPKLYSLSVSDTEEDVAVSKPLILATKLKNQDQFDDEGYASVPLLDTNQIWRFHAYRASYAHMLFTWDMLLARCEVLKYNEHSSIQGLRAKSITGYSPPVFAVGRSNTGSSIASEEKGLRLGLQIDRKAVSSRTIQQHKDPQPANFASIDGPLICLLCVEIIRGLCSPCFACGHVLHTSCRSIISSQTLEATTSGECISGCGCRCAEHAIVEIGLPLQYPISPFPAGTGNTSNEQEQEKRRGEAGNDEDAWEDIQREDVAYESLARVRERYITPKPSQVWRGG